MKAQRDRFRRRIKELEAEREDEQREARGARGVMESLQKDNLQLYEKVSLLVSSSASFYFSFNVSEMLHARLNYVQSMCLAEAAQVRPLHKMPRLPCLLVTQVRFLQSYQRGAAQGAANSGRGAISDNLEDGRGVGIGAYGEEQVSVVVCLLRYPL